MSTAYSLLPEKHSAYSRKNTVLLAADGTFGRGIPRRRDQPELGQVRNSDHEGRAVVTRMAARRAQLPEVAARVEAKICQASRLLATSESTT